MAFNPDPRCNHVSSPESTRFCVYFLIWILVLFIGGTYTPQDSGDEMIATLILIIVVAIIEVVRKNVKKNKIDKQGDNHGKNS